MNRLEASLNVVVALPAEAKALNRILQLQRLEADRDFPLYAGNGVVLIVAGPGLQAIQTGVRYLQRRNVSACAGWLNIGIAGHADLPLGQAVIASRVIGPEPGFSRELQHLSCPGCRSLPVCTVTTPETGYPHDWAYEMEAAGFVNAALESAPLGSIQVVKFVSDTRQHSTRAINAKMVKQLLLQQASLIRQIIERMQDHVTTSSP
jgi:hypothetical protein